MKLGIIGCGNMGSAIASGILSKRVFPFNNIYVSDKDAQKTKGISKKYGARISTNDEIVKNCELIMIAVKPQDFRTLLASISHALDHAKHLISIMAGVTISAIESFTKEKIAVTRAMPNFAVIASKGMTCLSHNRFVKNKSIVHKVFESIGEVLEIEEKYMDQVTAVSGSGPAYFFYLTECLRDAAFKLGIKKEFALKLAVQTLVGSAALVEAMPFPPEDLRERITSKKGTTERALHILESRKMKEIIEEAVKAAALRSKELSAGSSVTTASTS